MKRFASLKDVRGTKSERLDREFGAWRRPGLQPRDSLPDGLLQHSHPTAGGAGPASSAPSQVGHLLDTTPVTDPTPTFQPEKLNDSTSTHKMDERESRPTMGPAYYQCKSSRRATTRVTGTDISTNTSVGTGTEQDIDRLGSFDSTGCMGLESCFLATRQTQHKNQQNISLSFDPSTLTCVSCKDTHNVMENSEGTPITIICTDHCFPAHLSDELSEGCVRVVRLEDGMLSEIVDLVAEIFSSGLPDSAVLLLGSGTNLKSRGSVAYTADWVDCVNKVNGYWPTVQLCPIFPVFPTDVTGGVYRSLVEIGTWFKKQYGSDHRGLCDAWDAYLQMTQLHSVGSSILTAREEYVLAFPAGIGSIKTYSVMHFASGTSSPASIQCFGQGDCEKLIRALVNNLNRDLATGLDPEHALPRVPAGVVEDENTKDSEHIIVCGASHMKRVCSILEAKGHKVTDLTVPGWAASKNNVQNLCNRVEHALMQHPAAVVVLDLLSNSSYKFVQEDDSLAGACRLKDGWRMLGNVVTICDSETKNLMSRISPVLNCLSPENITVFVPPIPRYVFGGCCTDSTHAPNTTRKDHPSETLAAHAKLRNTIKKEILRTAEKRIWVLDLLGSLTKKTGLDDQIRILADLTDKDNVHLKTSGYTEVAEGILHSVDKLKSRHGTAGQTVSAGPARSRSLWRGFATYGSIGKTASLCVKNSRRTHGSKPYTMIPFGRKK